MTRTDAIRRKLSSSYIPDHIKLFLFGLFRHEPTEAEVIMKPRIPRHYKSGRVNFAHIEQKLMQWVDDPRNLPQNPDLEELADMLNVERSRLLAYFSNYMKQDFRSWKSEMKMKKARALLLDADKAPGINEVAGQLGFRDKSNFHKIFKRYSGCTPGEWKGSGGHPKSKEMEAPAIQADAQDAEGRAPLSQD